VANAVKFAEFAVTVRSSTVCANRLIALSSWPDTGFGTSMNRLNPDFD